MKFNSEHEEYVYGLTGLGDGSVDSPIGWFDVVHLTEAADTAAATALGGQHVIVRENSDGIVTFAAFTTEDEAANTARMLQNAYNLWDESIDDEDARAAIDAYREAAEFTATDSDGDSLDGLGIPFSIAAQNDMRNDVIEFITANANDCRAFIEKGHSWTQVGIDFWLTRNGHGAGFWDRGAGEVGEQLTEASKAYGESHLYVSDAGEFEVQ